jgi:hypothetical protein
MINILLNRAKEELQELMELMKFNLEIFTDSPREDQIDNRDEEESDTENGLFSINLTAWHNNFPA